MHHKFCLKLCPYLIGKEHKTFSWLHDDRQKSVYINLINKNLSQQILSRHIFAVYHYTLSLYHCTNWLSLHTKIRYNQKLSNVIDYAEIINTRCQCKY